ncbi:MAG TPA: YitT family protein [Candidatus Mediterraneibacter guildfordensis]|nr:YitT family protein [Candidatus Mediterraneibacter guildfordensis]
MNSVFKLSNIFMILLGNAAMALGIVMFILPNGLMTGGTTGLSLIVGHYTSLPISAFVFLFNAVMFILGLVVLGRAFAMTTLLSTFFYPVALEFFQRIPAVAEGITGDRLLSSLFGGLFIGFALGIVIRAGASTGGMDIPPLILNKKFGLPVSGLLYAFDIVILIGQMLFSDKEAILYGILLVMTYTIVLDKVLVFGRAQTQVKIISDRVEEINTAINREMDRGSTLIHMATGYLKKEQDMIMTVISNRQLAHLNQLVTEIDPNAFMVVAKVNEVSGKGFTLPKHQAAGHR